MPSKKEKYLRRLVAAYVAYSYISKESKNANFGGSASGYDGFRHPNFGLKISNEIVDIASNLIDLQLYNEKRQGDEKPSDSDCFWVLLGISLTFLPEHFYQPVEYESMGESNTGKPTQNSAGSGSKDAQNP